MPAARVHVKTLAVLCFLSFASVAQSIREPVGKLRGEMTPEQLAAKSAARVGKIKAQVLKIAPVPDSWRPYPNGRLKVTLRAPVQCFPSCSKGQKIKFNACGQTHSVTVGDEQNIVYGHKFSVQIPASMQKARARVLERNGTKQNMIIDVPSCTFKGFALEIEFPDGRTSVLQMEVNAKKITVPNDFKALGPTRQEKDNELAKMRCCCHGSSCMWYPPTKLKVGGHCPRLQLRPGEEPCIKSYCGFFGGKDCIQTHHVNFGCNNMVTPRKFLGNWC